MKTTNRMRMWVGMLAVACGLSTAQAKKKPVDFSAFEGDYKAQPTTIVYLNTAYQGSASLNVKVPKSGKSATITVSGFITAGDQSAPFSNTFFLKDRTIAVGDVLFLIEGSVTGGASGSLSPNGKGNRISYNVVFPGAPEIPMSGTISVVPQGKKKKKLTLVFQINAGSSNYVFTVVGVAKVPKKD